MSLTRTLAIAKKQLLSIEHDPRSLALMVLAPIMAILIFGFAFGTQPEHVRVLVVNQDHGALANQFINKINRTDLNIGLSSDPTDAKNQVKNGQAVAAVIFPKDFSTNALATEQIVPTKRAKAEIYIDTTDQQLSSVVSGALAAASQRIQSTNTPAAFSFETNYAFPKAKSASYINYFVAGIMVFAITVFTTLLTLLAFVSERTSGTLDRLRVTPVDETEIVVGYELAFGAIAAVQGILLLAIAYFVYHILIIGSVILAGILIVLTAIDAQIIGVLVSAAAKRESQAVQFLPFIIFPVFLLSGVFVPVQSLPNWLRPLSYLLPTTWSIDGIRDVLLRGWGLSHVWPHLFVLSAFAVVLTSLAIFSLKRNRQ